MTISASFTVTPRMWRGWNDPGLPVGAYIASGTVTGDASAGSQIIFFDFAIEGEPVSGRFYNIEQVSAHHSDNSDRGGSMRATNWESVGPTGLADRLWATLYRANAISDAPLSFEQFPQLPIFLGQPQPVPDLNSSVSFEILNTLNRVLFAQIQGYIWEPRSVMVNGGLRRPVEALYG